MGLLRLLHWLWHTPGKAGGCVAGVLVSLLVLNTAHTAPPPQPVLRVEDAAPIAYQSRVQQRVPYPDTTEADTTEADTTEARTTTADTTETGPPDVSDEGPVAPNVPMELLPAPPRALVDTALYRRAHASMTETLAEAPGSFLYHLGPVAWPHGWSRYGLPPHRADYWLNDRRYVDPITQQPRYDLLPALFTTRPSTTTPAGRQSALGLSQQWRFFTPDRPLTELRYRRGGASLQAVEIVHTQGRPVAWLGQPARFAATFGYGGATNDDTYPNTALDLTRQVLLRIRYQQTQWALDVTNYAVRHRLQTHGGVEPAIAGEPTTVFVPAQADVQTEGQRQTIRNDLSARLRWAWSDRLPATQLTTGWTSNTFDFSGFEDKRTLRSHVLTATLRQPLRVQSHAMQAVAYAEHQTAPPDTFAVASPGLTALHAGLRDSLTWRGTMLDASAYAHHHTNHPIYASGQLQAAYDVGPMGLTAQVASTARPSSRLETYGSAGLVTPLSDPVLTRTHRVQAGLNTAWRTLQARITAFGHRTERAVEAERGSDPLESTIHVVPEPLDVVGVSGRLRWRYDSARGLYAVVQGTALQVGSSEDPLVQQYTASLPEVYGRGRLGARFVLFQDLDIDLYAEAYGWGTAFRSRWFHSPTGQLTLPALDAPATPDTPGRLQPDGVLNIHAEADLRGAELMLSYENALGGTNVTAGTYVVPTYPLPNQRIRFSIHWPLFD